MMEPRMGFNHRKNWATIPINTAQQNGCKGSRICHRRSSSEILNMTISDFHQASDCNFQLERSIYSASIEAEKNCSCRNKSSTTMKCTIDIHKNEYAI